MVLSDFNYRAKLKNEFLEKVASLYNGKYQYPYIDKEYVNKNSTITIHCTLHDFTYKNTPINHIRRSGCKYCYKDLTSTGKETFLQRAKNAHGDKYDYSKVDYKTSREKVEIICPTHGSFWQTPFHHTTNKNGCPNCRLYKIRTVGRIIIAKPESIENWLTIIKTKHPNVTLAPGNEITGKEIKTKWICSKHGELYTTPKNIMRIGCKYCSRNSDKLREVFINKAKQVQGDNVDYSKTDLSEFTPTFICKKHGVVYQQERRNHIMYKGCPVCIADARTNTTDSFIIKAKEIHGDKYDYSKTKYISNTTKVTITCPEHGDFEVVPAEHLRKNRNPSGCKQCILKSESEKYALYLLDKNKINYIYQYRREPYNFRWDFVLPDIKFNIEIDDDSHWRNLVTIRNDKIKDKIMFMDGFNIIRLKYLRIDKLKSLLHKTLSSNIKYYRDGRCFRTFLDYCMYYNLPPETLPKDVEQFKFVLKI